MKSKNILAIVVFCLSTVSAQASTVFSPTDGNVNFLGSITSAYTLALFDNDDLFDMEDADYLKIPMYSLISFANNYEASNASRSIDLGDSYEFVLGLTSDSGSSWFNDTSTTALGGDMYQVNFIDINIDMIIIDVQTSAAPVPVPASVWLLGTGLIGLAGVAHRRSKA